MPVNGTDPLSPELRLPRRHSGLLLAGALLLLLGALVWWLHGVYVERENRHRHQAERELQSINQLQLQAVLGWRQRVLRDGNMLAEDGLLADAFARWIRHADVHAHAHISARLRAMKEVGQYTAAYLVDPLGRVHQDVGADAEAPLAAAVSATDLQVLHRAFLSATALMTDPVSEPELAFPYASLFVPLYQGERALGALWLLQDMRTGLIPLVDPWPTPSRTARSSIVWREGQAARYLNPPPGIRAGALEYSDRLDARPTAVTQALQGMRGVFYAVDERGREVMAMSSPVQGSNWLLVSAVEVAEVFADVRRRELFALSLPVALVLLALAAAFVAVLRKGWHRERALKQALQRNLLWLESAQQAATIGHFAIDHDRGQVQMSALCGQIHGVLSLDMALSDWLALIADEDREQASAAFAGGADVQRIQYRIHPADAPGTVRWVEAWGRLSADGDAGARLSGVVQDISARKAVEAELAAYRAQLEALLRTDALTGVANRRALDEAARVQVALAIRGATPLSVLMIDVDHFKAYNDRYGHPAGDRCLCQVAAALKERVSRAGELVARYGGEEFAVLLPLVDGERARELAQRMCDGVRALEIEHAASATAHCVTISVGVACLLPDESVLAQVHLQRDATESVTATLLQQLFQAADHALYDAKRGGRNRAVLYAGGVPF